jgi:hypothetical protein
MSDNLITKESQWCMHVFYEVADQGRSPTFSDDCQSITGYKCSARTQSRFGAAHMRL